MRTPYYIVVQEYDYPVESGRDVVDDTFDTLEAAMKRCEEIAESEMQNFEDNVKQDVLTPGKCDDGYILTTKMGLDPYYFYVRVIRIEPGLCDRNRG